MSRLVYPFWTSKSITNADHKDIFKPIVKRIKELAPIGNFLR